MASASVARMEEVADPPSVQVIQFIEMRSTELFTAVLGAMIDGPGLCSLGDKVGRESLQCFKSPTCGPILSAACRTRHTFEASFLASEAELRFLAFEGPCESQDWRRRRLATFA